MPVATVYRLVPLEPAAADGTWEQPFDLVGVSAEQPPEWVFSNDEGSLTLNQWDDFIVSSGVQEDRAEVKDAEIVFVGYGMQAPEYDWDDFKDHDLIIADVHYSRVFPSPLHYAFAGGGQVF